MNNTTIPRSAKIALLAACFLWAASFIATKSALASIPPLTVVMLRLAISSLCFAAWLAVKKKKITVSSTAQWKKLLLLSLFGTGLHYSIQTIGLQYTTSSNASLYAITGPISITIIAVLFLGERLTLKKGVGIACALLGVLIVMGIATLEKVDFKNHLLGDALVFASIFMWGIFTVMGKDSTRRMGALELTAVVTFIGTAYMIPLSLWEIHTSQFSLSSIPFDAWAAVAFLGLTCSFLATLLYFMALERCESQKVGVYLYTIPPMNYIISAIYLGEIIGLNLVIGSIIVFAGVILTEKG